jgi:lysophospholipase L1-like esterase
MVVGDSVATTLGRGLERWGTTSGRAVVWNVGRYWCGLVRGSLEGGYGGSRDRCDSWPSLWAGQVAEFQPDLVVVQTTIWDSTGRMRPEWGQTRGPGDPVFEEARLADFHLAVEVLSAGGADVVWLTAPCARDSSEQQVQEFAGLNRALARVRGIRLLDLTGLVCPGGRFSPSLGRVEDARPDGLHFSDPGADWLAERLGPVLVTPEPPPGFPA